VARPSVQMRGERGTRGVVRGLVREKRGDGKNLTGRAPTAFRGGDG
jgi:hypothetical protein